MAGYAVFETNEFQKNYGKLDGSVRTHVDKSLARLSEDPFHNSKTLSHPFVGKRSFRIGKYRLIFAICEECRAHSWPDHNQCAGCRGRPDRSMILFTIGPRKNVYDG